jgi:hypothetical protein
MRLPRCVFPPQHLKAGIVELEETAFARQRLCKHVPTSMNAHATVEVLDAVFSIRSVSYHERDIGD